MSPASDGLGASDVVVQAAVRCGAQSAGEVRQLAALLAGAETEPDAPDLLLGCRSRLNNDGTPLQLCLSSDAQRCRVRLVGDPAAWRKDPAGRFAGAGRVLTTLAARRDCEALRPLCRQLFDVAVPPVDQHGLAAYKDGVAWLGAAPDVPGMAVYVEAAAQDRAAAWDTAARWMRRCLAAPEQALAIIDTLAPRARLASFGLEGSAPADARAKLYFRLDPPGPLPALGIDLFAGPAVVQFLNRAIGEFAMDPAGIVLCVGFSVATGSLIDAKIDLCGHCLAYSPAAWARKVAELDTTLALTPLPTAAMLAAGDCEVAFLGFGLRADGRRRLNLYAKPAPGASPYHEAISRGVGYLLNARDETGAWRDFELPVGSSDQWITAYAGLALAEAADSGLAPPAARAAAAAADWLVETRAYDAGWGYNAITGADADSTAFAVALLDRLGRPVPEADRRFLRDRWRPGGGIATYESSDAWGQAHPCVTPLAYSGLAQADRRRLRRDLIHYLDGCPRQEGLWPGYWWRRPYYATLCVLDVLHELGEAGSRITGLPDIDWHAESDAFNRACIAGIEQHRGAPDNRLWAIAASLLARQAGDGHWPGSPNLRVTDETCWRPWDGPRGQVFADPAGILTTATVLRVLVRLLRERPGPPPAGATAAQTGVKEGAFDHA